MTTACVACELEIDDPPSGLGWLPDGRLLVVAMESRRVLRVDADGSVVTHADLAAIATGPATTWSSRPTAPRTWATSASTHPGAPRRAAALARVPPDGQVSVAADGLEFPNGTVITPDGRTLVVGETLGRRVTAFTIAADGTLHDRRVWADLGDVMPDGCTLDAEGAIWFADAASNAVVRVREGGEVTDRVDAGQRTFACALGGDDGRTLFVLCADSAGEGDGAPTGTIRTLRVDVPHAGLPYDAGAADGHGHVPVHRHRGFHAALGGAPRAMRVALARHDAILTMRSSHTAARW